MGGGKAGSVARSHAVNLTLIVIYKGKVRKNSAPSSGIIAAQSFIHEAPGLHLPPEHPPYPPLPNVK